VDFPKILEAKMNIELSKRAKHTIQKMDKGWAMGSALGGWGWAGGFSLLTEDEIRGSLADAKKDGFIKNVGKVTINEIIAFHRLLKAVFE
jgi:hypothetical protein